MVMGTFPEYLDALDRGNVKILCFASSCRFGCMSWRPTIRHEVAFEDMEQTRKLEEGFKLVPSVFLITDLNGKSKRVIIPTLRANELELTACKRG